MQCAIIDKYFSSMGVLLENEKQPTDYGSGELLYSSEALFLRTVSSNPQVNAVELSKILNVTRGAITQLGNKLEQRKFIHRQLKDGSKKEKRHLLTTEGKAALNAYEIRHREANAQMCAYLSSLSEEEKAVILNFLEKLSSLPISHFTCTSAGCIQLED